MGGQKLPEKEMEKKKSESATFYLTNQTRCRVARTSLSPDEIDPPNETKNSKKMTCTGSRIYLCLSLCLFQATHHTCFAEQFY